MSMKCDTPECINPAQYLWAREDPDPTGLAAKRCFQCGDCGPPALFEDGKPIYSAKPLGGIWAQNPDLGFTTWEDYWAAGRWETADGWTILELADIIG